MPKMEFKKNKLDIPIETIKDVARTSEFFTNDCREMMDKSLGSYTTGYLNYAVLRGKILNSVWRFTGTELSEDKKIERFIFTVKIDCYDGILDINKLKSKDIIFAVPANRLIDYKPVVLSPTGIATKYMSIAISKEKTGLSYVGLYAGRKKKHLIITLAYGAEVAYKLLNPKWLKGYKCENILRIDSSISAKYIAKIALRNAISKGSKLIENLYMRHYKHKRNYKVFLSELSELNWKQSNNNQFVYYATGMEGYRKYINLDTMNSNTTLKICEGYIKGNTRLPSLVVENSEVISQTITIKVYVVGNRISIVDAYFGDMPKDDLMDTKEISTTLTVAEALKLGFNKARVLNYSPFDELRFDTFIKYLDDTNKYRNIKCKYYGTSKEIDSEFLDRFEESSQPYYKEVILPKPIPTGYLELISEYISSCKLLTCNSLICQESLIRTLSEDELKDSKRILVEIRGSRLFRIGGVRNEVLVYEPKLTHILRFI